jgi:sugar lactone lactonase YvrE
MQTIIVSAAVFSLFLVGCNKVTSTSTDELPGGNALTSTLPGDWLNDISPLHSGLNPLDPTPLEPGWTVETFVSGLSYPANGLEFDRSTGGFYVGEYGADRVTYVDADGNPSFFAHVPIVDELALDRTSTFLFAKEHTNIGPIYMFDTEGTLLGTIPLFGDGFPTGISFDSQGNFYVALSPDTIIVFDASTLPPNRPVPSLYATGFQDLEGMRFDSEDNLLVTENRQGNVLQVVPPSGPHITWVSGQNVPINVAFDPCTDNLFVSIKGSGTILRVTNPGVFTTFATNLAAPYALDFDTDGNLYINESITGRIMKFVTPNPCGEVFPCPLTKGFWKNHSDRWPINSLNLGSESYTKEELLSLLWTPIGGRRGADASLILAHQLIATQLSIANGSEPDPIEDIIAEADELLSRFSDKLPYRIRPSSGDGQEMVRIAEILDDYNNGILTPDCEGREDNAQIGF